MTELTSLTPIRLLVADHDAAVLAAVADLLAGEPGMDVVATAREAREAVRLAADHRPDVAIIDFKVAGGGGPLATREIARLSPGTRVIAHSIHDDLASVSEMIRAGATGFVRKGAPITEIVEAVERASRGLASLSAESVAGVASVLDQQLVHRERSEREHRRVMAEVERALAPGGLRILYQPIVDLESRRLLGYEALSRFDVPPARTTEEWFAAAGSVDLGFELELAAVRAAMVGLEDLPPEAYLSVNLSPAAIVAGQAELVAAGLGDERVVIEVTEHAPVADYEALARALEPLRARGTRLAVDDAGAGFASLRHILRLGPDIIKLDVELTRGIDGDLARRSLASALIAFGTEMGITIVAEGVETHDELEALASLGVRCGQGYLLGRPAELPELPSR